MKAAWRAATFFAFMLIAGTGPAAALETELVPAFPNLPLHGPQAAKGAVIWSHGKGFNGNAALGRNPDYLALLRDDGWDVFRNNRVDEFREYQSNQSDMTRDSVPKAAVLSGRIDELKARGYRRVALAGQSYGAWLSLIVAGKRDDLAAVIANAPAAYGTRQQEPAGYQRNASFLYDMVDGIKASRVMIAFFRDDPYAPERRGPRVEAILSEHKIAHLVIDEPDLPTGHGGGNGRLFATRYGACLIAILDADTVPTRAACEKPLLRAPSADLPIPKDLKLASAQGGPVDPFLGAWWGIYGNGREVMFAVERVEGEKVFGIYVYGPYESSPAGMRHPEGRVSDGKLMFNQLGAARLEYRVMPDGTLEGTWSQGGTTLPVTMRRLSP